MINDDVFRTKMDTALKRCGVKKADRNSQITQLLADANLDRNHIIESAETAAEDYSKSKEIPLEHIEQKAFVEWFRKHYPDDIIMMIRNDGYRTPAERSEQLLMGLHPGASDLFIPRLRLFVEMKRVKGGKLSPEQEKFKQRIQEQGYLFFMAEGADKAIELVSKILVDKKE